MCKPTFTLFGERMLDSPFVFTAFVGLKEKGVPFEFRVLELARGDQREPSFVERSLTARVPTLTAGDFSLSESLAIVEYLDELLPAPAARRLMPAAREERARARQLLGWLRSDLANLRRERPTSSIFFERVTTPLGDAARADAGKLERVASALLQGRTQIFDDWSIADADLAMALMRLVASGDAVPSTLRAFVETQWQRASIARWVALTRPATAEVWQE
jgi:glutathione S-transferase